jgi:hypothetical protein
MKMLFHSALLAFCDAILPHWQSWNGNHYGNHIQVRSRKVARGE